MTRIPQLEQELVAAAERLQSPRRLVRPAARVGLAAAAVAAGIVLEVLGAADNDDNNTRHRRLPPSGQMIAPNLDLVDAEAGVRFNLNGRVLTVSLLASAPSETRTKVNGKWLRATCAKGFTEGPGPGPGPDRRQTRERLWPAGSTRLTFRFRGDISHIATWCRLEDPELGHIAFVHVRRAAPAPEGARSQEQEIEQTGNKWARLFAASDPAACDRYMTQPACERVACERAGGRVVEHCTPLSSRFVRSFRNARVKAVAFKGDRAAASFSNGETVEFVPVGAGAWWISELGPRVSGPEAAGSSG